MPATSTQVLLAGLELPQRWQGRERFVMLDTGFGDAARVLAAWAAWRDDAQRCGQLHLLAIAPGPASDVRTWRESMRAAHAGTPRETIARELADALPPPTRNLHRLALEGGQVQVLLAIGDPDFWLTQLVARVDTFWLDGLAGQARSWDRRQFKALARLAAPGATAAAAAAPSTEPALLEGLRTAGFVLTAHDTAPMTRARYEPAFTPRRGTARMATVVTGDRRAVIVGGGLAGCACAQALAELGWHSTVVDRHAEPASEASGNPAALFHGIVNPQDGAHARFNRAAALEAQRAVTRALRLANDRAPGGQPLRGSAQGLLRLETATSLEAMCRTLSHLNLPADYVQAVTAEQASALCGLPMVHPAWFYPGGGWVDPAGLARSCLAQAGDRTRWIGGVQVDALHRTAQGWAVLGRNSRVIAEAPVVVLANAVDTLTLLERLGQPAWPLQRVRGQISVLRDPVSHGLALPRIPVAGSGYLLPDVDGTGVFGATSQPGDDDPRVRDVDHVHNLAQLARLTGTVPAIHPQDLHGRTAWRCVSEDRLPLVGGVPDGLAARRSTRLDQPRFVPRVPGLFVFTALGSRGVAWSALGAQVLAACVSGAPSPLEAGLLDAVDPARFISRSARRASALR